jgi:hypothetical protein
MDNLTARTWNGTPIQRRTTDGYVNATAMAKANGKRWNNYFETDRASSYAETLSRVTGIPVTGNAGLVQTRQGGSDQGTWIHPQIAVDLARWISPEFAVWMDGWFLEELGGGRVSQVRDTQPVLPDVLTTVERSLDLLERLGGVDDRAEFVLRDIVLNHAARTAGGDLALPGARMLSLQEAFQQIAGADPAEASKLAVRYGRAVKQVYRDENGRTPRTHKQLVNGRSCDVCDYELDWLQQHASDLTEAVTEFRYRQ